MKVIDKQTGLVKETTKIAIQQTFCANMGEGKDTQIIQQNRI